MADKNMYGLEARPLAKARFHAKAVEVFYGVYYREDAASRRRDKIIPLVAPEGNAPVIVGVGNTGVGKTTLFRRFMGTDPITERFPATSGNRTTLFPFEVVVEDGRYRAAITFRSETETEQALVQMALKAVMKSLDQGTDEVILRELFEPTDDGLRLKYLLGVPKLGGAEAVDKLAQEWVGSVRKIAADASTLVHTALDETPDGLTQEARAAMRDLIEDEAEESAGMGELVSSMLEELRDRSKVPAPGSFSRTPTAWPETWTFEAGVNERERFIREAKRFTGNVREEFGNLLTPLVSGVRVAGQFYPKGDAPRLPLVLCDTVGLGHYAGTAGDLQEAYTALFDRADCILVVESARTAFSSASLHQVLEAVATGGHVKKLVVAFTNIDGLVGDDVGDVSEQQDKAMLGLRAAIDDHVAKKLSREAARQLTGHLHSNVFFFSSLQVPGDTQSDSELKRLLEDFARDKAQMPTTAAFPKYDFDFFAPFVIGAIDAFRTKWGALLGVRPHSGLEKLPWQAPKAIARRYAQGWTDDYPHRPVASLNALLRQEVAKFLDAPHAWPGQTPSDDEKQTVIDLVKAELNEPLLKLCICVLRTGPRTQWISAWEFRGINSTIRRRNAIEALYAQHVPYFRADDSHAITFIKDVRAEVESAISLAKGKLRRKALTRGVQDEGVTDEVAEKA